MKKIAYKLTILLLLTYLPFTVKAESSQLNVCLNNRLYSVIYDSDQSITKNMITIGEDGKPKLVDTESSNDFSIVFTEIGSKCRNDGDSIINCPEDGSIYTYSKIRSTYLYDNSETDKTTITDNIVLTLNQSTGKFNITIKDKFNDKLYIRYVDDESKLNTADDDEIEKYMSQFLTRSGSNYYINNIAGQKIIYLEFYIKDSTSKCKNTYIGYISFTTPTINDYEIDNPAISNPSAYSCDVIKKYKPDSMTNSDDISKLESIKQSYIYECYDNKKIAFSLVGANGETLKQTINEKFSKLKEMFSEYEGSSDTGNNVCTDSYSSGPRTTTATAGKYWSIVCTEKYTATGSEAKLVKAGGGFDYQANYTITRQCKITQISKPSLYPECTYSVDHSCDWNMSNGTRKGCSGSDCDGGPNNDFDICVKNCDNGKYSQECVNSCYQSIYNSERKLSINDQLVQKNGRIEFTSIIDSTSYTSANTGESCITIHNRDGFYIRYNYTEDGKVLASDKACFSTDFCAGKGAGVCTFYTFKQPDNCVADAKSVYEKELAASERELNDMIAIQNAEVPAGTYTYKIKDSYLKTDSGNPYVFTVSSSNNPAVNITKTQTKSSSSYQTKALGNSGGRSVSYYENVTVNANITTSLPLSYISKINGDVAYKTNSDDKQAFKANHKLNKIETITNFENLEYYNNSDRKYYTSIWSNNLNVKMIDGKVALFRTEDDYNITVESSNVGNGNFSSNIDCYYGVYNNYYCDDEEDCPSDCKGGNCPDQTGIQYIYRVIDLTDVFPNDRNPRWNWTGTLTDTSSGAARFSTETYLGYNIDPIDRTKDIESKGESIYTDTSEIDYEFYLTKENIKNIRDYNKHVNDYNGDGSNNYLDYNMSCYINAKKQEVCTSKFLDNINENDTVSASSNFVTYGSQFTIDSRKDLAGCNDAKGQSCIDKYK